MDKLQAIIRLIRFEVLEDGYGCGGRGKERMEKSPAAKLVGCLLVLSRAQHLLDYWPMRADVTDFRPHIRCRVLFLLY